MIPENEWTDMQETGTRYPSGEKFPITGRYNCKTEHLELTGWQEQNTLNETNEPRISIYIPDGDAIGYLLSYSDCDGIEIFHCETLRDRFALQDMLLNWLRAKWEAEDRWHRDNHRRHLEDRPSETRNDCEICREEHLKSCIYD